MSADGVREARLWAWLKTASLAFTERLHMNRIENRVGTGCADVEACFGGVQLWIELKTATRPSKPSTRIRPRFEDSQWPWHRRRAQAGTPTFVLLQVGSGKVRYLLPGHLIPRLQSPGMTEDELGAAALCPCDARATEVLLVARRYVMDCVSPG